MLTVHLSKRLKAVLSFIPENADLADIGSDHAYLPCRAVQEGIVRRSIAGEVREGPFQKALVNVRALGLTNQVSVRLGDGLDIMKRGEVGTVVIAGMGGELITEILGRGLSKLTDRTVLILQPNIREPECRLWLSSHSWRISDEAIVEEGGHFYEVIKAEKHLSGSLILTEEQLLMGPILMQRKSPVFRKKWLFRAAKLEEVLHALKSAQKTEAVKKKIKECRLELAMIWSQLKEKFGEGKP
ncbi:SAM-dependent methyltransferase [Sporolactobacillus sp. THM7-7]|nr:SAM-dependent methyltransferase [Sporolactobacillus sp. THM7-7]